MASKPNIPTDVTVTSLFSSGNLVSANALSTGNVFTNNVLMAGNMTITGARTPGKTSLTVLGNVTVSNTFFVSNIYAANAVVKDTLTVTGNIVASNTLTTSKVYMTGSGAGSSIIRGTNDAGKTTLNVTGNLWTANAITTGNIFASGNVTSTGNVLVTGTTTLGKTTLFVTGNAVMSNTLTSGNVFIIGNVFATGNVVITGVNTLGMTSLYVTGNANVSNTLTTSSVLTGNVVVTGAQTTGKTSLNVSANVTTANSITTSNLLTTNVYASGNVVVTGAQTIGATTLSVTGNMYVSNTLTMSNLYTTNVYATGNVVVTGAQTIGATTLSMTGNMYVANSLSVSNIYVTNVYATGNIYVTNVSTIGQTSLSATGNMYASNALETSNMFISNAFATGVMTAKTITLTGNMNVSNTLTSTNVFANSYVLTGYYPAGTPAYNGATTMNVYNNVYVSNAVTTTNAWAYNNVYVTSNVGLLTTNIWGDTVTGGLNADKYSSGATISAKNRIPTYREVPIGTTPTTWYGDETYDTNYVKRNIAGTTYVQATPTPATPSIIQITTQTIKTGFQTKLIPINLRPAIVDGNFEVYAQYIGASGFVYTPTTSSWTWNATAGSGIVLIGSLTAGSWGSIVSPSTSNVYLGIQNSGAVSQSITGLIPGARYSVSFYMNARPGGLDGNNLNVNIGGNPAATGGTIAGGTTIYTNASVGSTTNWQYITTTAWTATAASMPLIFGSTSAGPDKTVFLDQIRLNSLDNFQQVTWSMTGQPDGVHLTNISNTGCNVVVPKGLPITTSTIVVSAANATGSTTMSFTLTTGTYVGTISALPATNAVSILAEWPTAPDGIYWINVNGTATQTYCLMDQKWDGGGWMLLMKMTRGTTFQYSSTYWTDQANTLNPTDLNRRDNDAKFAAYNHVPIKDIMGIWPDVGYTGGSIRGDLNVLVSCAANTYPRENFYYGTNGNSTTLPYLFADTSYSGYIHALNVHNPPVIGYTRNAIDGIPFVSASNQSYDLGAVRLDVGTRGFTGIVEAQLTSYVSWQRFFDIGNNSIGGYYIFLAASGSSGVIRFAMGTPASGEQDLDTGTTGSTTQFTTFNMNVGQKYTLAAVYDPAPGTTGLMMLYVDGTLVQTFIPNVHMLDTTYQRCWIGRSQYNDAYLNATVWNTAIYNTVLTASQIQGHKFTHEQIQSVPRGVGGDAWTWRVNNWWQDGARTSGYNGFLAANSRDVPGQQVDFFFFDGFSRNIFNSQHPTRRFVMGGNSHLAAAGIPSNINMRWGFLMNENNYNDYTSGDGAGGVGFAYGGNYSAGDQHGCCSQTTGANDITASIGINRSMRFELYGR